MGPGFLEAFISQWVSRKVWVNLLNCIDSLYLCDSFFSVSACSFLCKIYRINSLLLYYYSWAVVIPRDARNPNKPQKFELAIYPAVEVTS